MAIKSNLNILVVEDDSYVAQHLQVTLESFNEGQMYLAQNAKEALDIISSEKIELVLMDILLPGDMDGITVAEEINKLKSVPIVYLTGHSDNKYLPRLAHSEPFGYLLKPVQPIELQAVLSIASQKHSNQLLLQRESDISTTLQKIFYPLVVTDENLDITSMNEAAHKMFLFKKGNASLLKFYKHEKPLLLGDALDMAKSSTGLFKDEEGITLHLENGSIIPVSLTMSIVYDARKEIKAVCIMFVDLTQQMVEKNELHNKQLEAAELLINERILKDVLNIGKDINKALLFEDSLKNKLLTSLNRIVQFANFNIAHILMHEEANLLSFVTSNNGSLYLSNRDVLQHEDIFSQRIYKALHKQEIDLWTESDGEFPSLLNERAKHLPIKSVLILPLKNKTEEKSHGVLIITSSHEYAFSIDIVNYFEEFANSMSLSISLYKHQEEIEKLKSEKLSNYEQTILSFIQVQEERDMYTKGHSQRVADYALMLAKEMNLDEQTCTNIYKAGILHDIGKIQTPDKILLKPSFLTDDERTLIEEHVNAGVRMLRHIEMYKEIIELIQLHHERYDGTGYPNKVDGSSTPIAAAILQVADVFDAMTTTRVYKKSLSLQEALSELKKASGTQFNPSVVDVALKLFKNISLNQTESFIYSQIDQERMAYYFQDSLTHLYNEEYLSYIGTYINKEKFHFVMTIRLAGLSVFNDTYTWCEGNKKLSQIAQILKNIASQDNAIAFRVHGNRFLLISRQEHNRTFMEEQLKGIVDEKGLLNLDVDAKNIKEIIKGTNIDAIHEIFHKLVC